MRWAMVGSRCADIWACLSRANHIHDATVPKSFAAEWPRRISSTTASRPHLGHRAHHGGVPKADIAPTAIIEQSPNARCHSVPMLRSRQCVFSVNQVASTPRPDAIHISSNYRIIWPVQTSCEASPNSQRNVGEQRGIVRRRPVPQKPTDEIKMQLAPSKAE